MVPGTFMAARDGEFMYQALRRHWIGLGVVGKLSAALGAMVALVIFVGAVGSFSLEKVRNRADEVVGRNMRIQELALRIESGLHQARQAEKDFLLQWTAMGFRRARDIYASQCIRHVDLVVADSDRLRRALDEADSRGFSFSPDSVNHSEILTAAASYGHAFKRAVSLVALLADEDTGLQGQLQHYLEQVESTVTRVNDDALVSAYRLYSSRTFRYMLTRSRGDMMRALDSLAEFEAALKNRSDISQVDREKLLSSVRSIRTKSQIISDTDQALSRTVEEFDRQMNALKPEVAALVSATAVEAQGIRNGIDEASTIAIAAVCGALLLSIILAAFIFRLLYSSVGRNVLTLSRVAKELSQGNLAARAEIDTPDEFGKLAATLNGMSGRINDLVDDLENRVAMASGRLMDAIESISDGFALYDENDRLVLCNGKYREMDYLSPDHFHAGMTFEQIIRSNVENDAYVVTSGHREEWIRARLEAHRNPGLPFEQHLTGDRYLLISEFKTMRGEIVSIVSDITKRKHAEEELFSLNADLEEAVRERTKVLVTKTAELQRANRRLLELDKMKSNFLSTVSHELRTPLTSLLGFSRLIDRDFSKVFRPMASDAKSRKIACRIHENLEIIRTEGERLTRLINDVLDLSRIETGRVEWRDENMSLERTILQAVQSVSGQFVQKPEVELEVGDLSDLPVIHADADRIQQVFINLLNNAAKFTEKGSVRVEGGMDKHGYAIVRVKDTGIGVPKEDLNSIFDRFQQSSQGDTLRAAPSGSGLGLAICRQILERYNGHVWAESRVGKGTTIHVAFPASSFAGTPLWNRMPKDTILVVDDDPAMRQILGATLKKNGFRVHYAGSGQDGLSAAHEIRPDLVTMDLFMPGMSGRETIEEFRVDPELCSIPIVVVSVDREGEQAGGNATIFKPVDMELFVKTVNILLRESHHQGAAEGFGLDDGCPVVSELSSSADFDRMIRDGVKFMVVPGASASFRD